MVLVQRTSEQCILVYKYKYNLNNCLIIYTYLTADRNRYF